MAYFVSIINNPSRIFLLSSFKHRDLEFLHKFISAATNNIDHFELNNANGQTSFDINKQKTQK